MLVKKHFFSCNYEFSLKVSNKYTSSFYQIYRDKNFAGIS